MSEQPSPLFLRALRREPTERPPVWFMRQAGRYLPEYRAVRAKTDFLGLCKTPELACEVTLQPIRRFAFDASIVFSDILIVPEAMGLDLSFGPGEGPRFGEPVRNAAAVDRLRVYEPGEETPFLLDTIRLLVRELPASVPLIGFAGAPFTVASYMVEGQGSKHFLEIKRMMYEAPALFEALLDKLVRTTISHLKAQAEAGCRALMLFDTWAGELGPSDLARFAVAPAARIIEALRPLRVPVVYFARGCADALDVVARAGADAYGLDWRARIARSWATLGPDVAVQGNLDPAALFAPVDVVRVKTHEVLAEAAGRPGHVFNLGHGILPETPIASVEAVLEVVHGSANA
ncbi:MAG: uroporphyrinogen decarboxylase [Myxococcota bacterium]